MNLHSSSLPTVATFSFHTHSEAEEAVHRLQRGGIPLQNMSIVGRDFQVREQIQGYYRPADAAREGAGVGAWFGGIFAMLMGFGLFVIPVAGMVLVLGPLSGLVAGAIAGAGVGALVEGLVALGLPRNQALRFVERVQAGQFLVLVNGTNDEIALAHTILDSGASAVQAVAE